MDTAVNGVAISDWNYLLEYLEFETEVGQRIMLMIVRDGNGLSLEVTVVAQPQE